MGRSNLISAAGDHLWRGSSTGRRLLAAWTSNPAKGFYVPLRKFNRLASCGAVEAVRRFHEWRPNLLVCSLLLSHFIDEYLGNPLGNRRIILRKGSRQRPIGQREPVLRRIGDEILRSHIGERFGYWIVDERLPRRASEPRSDAKRRGVVTAEKFILARRWWLR